MGSDRLIQEIEAAFGTSERTDVDRPIEAEFEAWVGMGAAAFCASLPLAMRRTLGGGEGRGLRFWLTLPLSGDGEIYLSKWSSLDEGQRACVGRFLVFMAEASRAKGRPDDASLWEEAYESYWEP